ncbi:MAG TPA: hypothetical protein PKC28_01400 [Bdellovibrionales bacterium]|nr:hypothetical protein [Bdellovibrionales bacterium]
MFRLLCYEWEWSNTGVARAFIRFKKSLGLGRQVLLHGTAVSRSSSSSSKSYGISASHEPAVNARAELATINNVNFNVSPMRPL